MTNKTITLSRELVEELLDGFLDPRCTIAKAIQSALADPVPPAGGEMEVLAWIDRSTDSGVILTLTGEKSSVDNIGLVDRAHVTQLKAEVTEQALCAASEARRAIRAESELTKARELLRNCTDCVRNGEDFDLPVTTMSGIDAFLSNQSAPADQNSDWEDTFGPDYEVDENDLARGVSETDNLLPVRDGYCQCGRLVHRPQINQSAPADKGQGDPVALQHMAVAEDGKLRWMSGRKMQNCELYALPDGSAIRFPLYAEQPAPVAVVMPERKTWDGLRATACNLKGEAWNACLDEVARLNSEPKP